ALLWVVALEADAAWARNNKTLAGIPGTFGSGGQGVDFGATAFDSSNVKLGWDGSVRGRVGFLVTPTWLLYATGGVTWQQADINATCNGSLFNSSWFIAARDETLSDTQAGCAIGDGGERVLWRKCVPR